MGELSIAREMRPNCHLLDEDSASRLLQGLVHPDDAPPGYGAVAALLNSAAQLPLGLVDEDAAATTVSAMVEVIRDATPTPETSRRKTMLGKLLAGKALAATAVAVLGLTATGAAAATGSLPDPAQGVVSDALSHVGVDIPHPNHGKSADHRQDGNHDEAPAGDDSGEQDKGMSGVVEGLKDAPRTAESGPLGQQVCIVASKGNCVHDNQQGTSGDDEGTPPSGDNESDVHGKSGEEHGKPEVTPAEPTTPAGSIQTGADNSGRELPSGKGKPDSDS
jgi:hypothetical protein